MVSSPLASRATRAWRRESSRSSLSLPSPLTPRPMTSSSPRLSRRPERRPGGDDQHLSRLRRDGGGLAARAARRRSAPAPAGTARAVGHLQDRPAHPHDVAGSSVRGASMRSSFTNVPLADPRSSIVSCPSAPRETWAWRREISGSSPSLRRPRGPRGRSAARRPRSGACRVPCLRSPAAARRPSAAKPTRLPRSPQRGSAGRDASGRMRSVSAIPPADAQSVSDLKARVEAERAGRPFLLTGTAMTASSCSCSRPTRRRPRSGASRRPICCSTGTSRSRACTPASSGSGTIGSSSTTASRATARSSTRSASAAGAA